MFLGNRMIRYVEANWAFPKWKWNLDVVMGPILFRISHKFEHTNHNTLSLYLSHLHSHSHLHIYKTLISQWYIVKEIASFIELRQDKVYEHERRYSRRWNINACLSLVFLFFPKIIEFFRFFSRSTFVYLTERLGHMRSIKSHEISRHMGRVRESSLVKICWFSRQMIGNCSHWILVLKMIGHCALIWNSDAIVAWRWRKGIESVEPSWKQPLSMTISEI